VLDSHEELVLVLLRNEVKGGLDNLVECLSDIPEGHRSDVQQSVADSILTPCTSKA
jgi:hypothetical protein